MLGQHGVTDAYRKAHQACAMAEDRGATRGADVQGLVTARKLMRAWAKRRPLERG